MAKDPKQGNEARKIAMHLCQKLSGTKLTEIMDYFGLSSIESASFITHQVRKKRQDIRAFYETVEPVINYIMNKVTHPLFISQQ